MEIEVLCDSTEIISNISKSELFEFCQEVYDEMSDWDKARFLEDNLGDAETEDIIDEYQKRVIGD